MTKRLGLRWVAVALVGVFGLRMGVAGAQNAPAAGGGTGAADVPSVHTAHMAPQDQLRNSSQIIDTISSTRRRVSDLLDRARQERDIIKANCLDDKLTQIDVTLRSARDHHELLTTAVETNNDGQRNHEHALQTIFRQRVEALDAEARQCIGEEASGFGQRNELTVRVNPNIPTGDNTYYMTNSYTPERPLVQSSPM